MSAKRQELHDLLLERRLSSSGGMPTAEELERAEAVLSYVEEFFVEPVARRVFKLLNEEYEKCDGDYRPETPPVTFEDVGALLSCVTDIRCTLDSITGRLDALEGERRTLSIAVAAGRIETEPNHTKYGTPTNFDESAQKAMQYVAEAVGAR